jgi:hypothetical protein
MLRAAALSLVVLFSVAVVVPIMDSSAHNDRPAKVHRHRRHSRAWWRRHHARIRRRRAIALQRARQQRLEQAKLRGDEAMGASAHHVPTGGLLMDPRGLWSATLPAGWSGRPAEANGEVKLKIFTTDGRPAGYASLSPVNVSASPKALLSVKARKQFLGDFAFGDLRRIVIDKMVAEKGWVTNDFVREVDGRRVYLVTAASASGGAVAQPWSFFFTEIDGHIYSLTTTAPAEFFDQANAGSERLLASFKSAKPATVASR